MDIIDVTLTILSHFAVGLVLGFLVVSAAIAVASWRR